MRIKPSDTLYVSERGVVACSQHGGAYLRAAVERDPHARQHVTPLDSWIAVDRDELPSDLAACEGCSR